MNIVNRGCPAFNQPQITEMDKSCYVRLRFEQPTGTFPPVRNVRQGHPFNRQRTSLLSEKSAWLWRYVI